MTKTYQRQKGYRKLSNTGNDPDRLGPPKLESQETGPPDVYQTNNPPVTQESGAPTQLEDTLPDLKYQQTSESVQKKVILNVN